MGSYHLEGGSEVELRLPVKEPDLPPQTRSFTAFLFQLDRFMYNYLAGKNNFLGEKKILFGEKSLFLGE